MIDGIDFFSVLGLSDHLLCLWFNFNFYCSTNHTSKPCYNIHQADTDKMRQLLASIEWDDLLTPLDIHSAYTEFSVRLTNVLHECVPYETPRQKKNLFMT